MKIWYKIIVIILYIQYLRTYHPHGVIIVYNDSVSHLLQMFWGSMDVKKVCMLSVKCIYAGELCVKRLKRAEERFFFLIKYALNKTSQVVTFLTSI